MLLNRSLLIYDFLFPTFLSVHNVNGFIVDPKIIS